MAKCKILLSLISTFLLIHLNLSAQVPLHIEGSPIFENIENSENAEEVLVRLPDGKVVVTSKQNLEAITQISIDDTTKEMSYLNEEGTISNFNLCDVVEHCETVTTLSFDYTTFELTYIRENGFVDRIFLGELAALVSHILNANENPDTRVIATHTAGDGTVTQIEETVTSLVNNEDGSFIYTSENGTETEFAETLTSFDLDNTTNEIKYIDENGTETFFDLCTVINNCETVTNLSFDSVSNQLLYEDEEGTTNAVDLSDIISQMSDENANLNTHIIATHTAGDGTVTQLEETVSTLVNNQNGSFVYTSENGTETLFSETLTQIELNNTSNEIQYTDENGVLTKLNLCEIIENCETVTNLNIDYENGVIIYINENGIIQAFDLPNLETITSLTDNNNGSFTYKSEDGTETTYNETLTSLDINNTSNEISYTDEEGNLTSLNLCAIVDNCETVTLLGFDAVSKQLTYVDEEGNTNVVSLSSLISQMSDDNPNLNTQIIATHTSGDGTVTQVEETVTSLVNNADGSFTYISEDGNETLYSETVTTIGIDNISNNINYRDENGNVTTLNLCSVVDNCETVTSLTFDPVNKSLIYVDENGNLFDIALEGLGTSEMTDLNSNLDAQIIGRHVNSDGVVTDLKETVTTLETNFDGSFTYKSEDGTETTYNETLTSIDINNTNNEISYTDEEGNLTSLNLCAIVDNCETVTFLGFDAVSNQLTYLDEEGNTNVVSLSSLISQMSDDNTNLNTQIIATHTSGDGTVTQVEETVTSLVNNADGSFTYISEDGNETLYSETVTTIDIDNISNNINYRDENGNVTTLNLCSVVDNCETVTSLTFDPVNKSLIYVDENGNLFDIALEGLGTSEMTDLNSNLDAQIIGRHVNSDGVVTDLKETVTTLETNFDGSFTYKSEDGTETTYNETLTSLDINNTSNEISYTDEEGNLTSLNLCAIVDNCETVTFLGFDAVSNQLTYIDEEGNTNVVSLSSLISQMSDDNTNLDTQVIATHTSGDGTVTQVEETVTSLVNNADGSFTYISEDGDETIYSETVTTIDIDNISNNINYRDENGNVTTLNLCNVVDNCETVTSLTFDPVNNSLIYVDENGNLFDIALEGLGTSEMTDLNSNLDAQIIGRHINSDGVVTDLKETVTTLETNFDGSFTYKSEDGTETTYNETLTSIDINNTNNEISYTDEEGNLTSLNLCAIVDNCETVTLLGFDAVSKQLTYLDEEGNTNVVSLSSLISQMSDDNTNLNTQIIATHTSGDGTVTQVEETVTSLVNNADGSFTYISEDGNETLYSETVTTIGIDNISNNINYRDENGNVTTLNLCSVVDNCETVTSLTFDPMNKSLIYVDENGNLFDIALEGLGTSEMTDLNSNLDAQIIGKHVNSDGVVTDLKETVTTLETNFDGSFTYKSEDGTETTYNETLTSLDINNTSNEISYTDEEGNLTSLNLCAIVDNCETVTLLGFDAVSNQLTYLDEEDNTNVVSLSSLISQMSDDNTNLNTQIIATHTSGDGTVTQVEETVTQLVDNENGSYTYTSEDGTQTIIDLLTKTKYNNNSETESLNKNTSYTVSKIDLFDQVNLKSIEHYLMPLDYDSQGNIEYKFVVVMDKSKNTKLKDISLIAQSEQERIYLTSNQKFKSSKINNSKILNGEWTKWNYNTNKLYEISILFEGESRLELIKDAYILIRSN